MKLELGDERVNLHLRFSDKSNLYWDPGGRQKMKVI